MDSINLMITWFSLETLIAMLLVFIGSFVQTGIGFGLAIVVAPFLFMLNPDYIPVPLCLVVLLVSIMNTLKHKKNLQIGALKAAMLGRIPGSLIGGIMLMLFSSKVLELYLGCLVLLAVAVSLCSIQIKPTPIKMGIAGFFSGVFGTSVAIGGPPMALLLQHEQAGSLRANLSAFFLFSSVISLFIQLLTGFFEVKHLLMTLPLLPAVFLGHKVAHIQSQKLPLAKMRIPVLSLCCISGLVAVVHGIN